MKAGSKELILTYLEGCPDKTSPEIAAATGISRETVRRTLRVLYKEGKVERVEPMHKSRANIYRIAPPGTEPRVSETMRTAEGPAPVINEEAKKMEEKARLKKEWLAYRKQKWGYR